MAYVEPAGVQLPPPAPVHRQRFYFLRHGQSTNNLCSLHDEPDPHLDHHQQMEEESQQRRPSQRSSRIPDQRTRHLIQYQRQREFSAHLVEQGHKQHSKAVYQRDQQQYFSCGNPRKRRWFKGQKRLSAQWEDELHLTGVSPEQQQAGRFSKRVADPSLTEVGRQQAAAAALWVQRHVQDIVMRSSNKYKQMAHQAGERRPFPAIRKIVCSPMRRAVETAAELRKVLMADVYVHPLLFEQGGLFSGPRKIPAYTASISGHSGEDTAHGEGCLSRGGEGWERATDYRSQTSSAPFMVRGVRRRSQKRRKKAVAPAAARRACPYFNQETCEGLTLQEVTALLPGVKIIDPCARFFCNQGCCARARNSAHAEVLIPEGGSNLSASSSTSVLQCNVAAKTVERSGNSEMTAQQVAADSEVAMQHDYREKVKKDEAGGHYCKEWTRGGRSWWCGGREKLVDTVVRAAEIVS